MVEVFVINIFVFILRAYRQVNIISEDSQIEILEGMSLGKSYMKDEASL